MWVCAAFHILEPDYQTDRTFRTKPSCPSQLFKTIWPILGLMSQSGLTSVSVSANLCVYHLIRSIFCTLPGWDVCQWINSSAVAWVNIFIDRIIPAILAQLLITYSAYFKQSIMLQWFPPVADKRKLQCFYCVSLHYSCWLVLFYLHFLVKLLVLCFTYAFDVVVFPGFVVLLSFMYF